MIHSLILIIMVVVSSLIGVCIPTSSGLLRSFPHRLASYCLGGRRPRLFPPEMQQLLLLLLTILQLCCLFVEKYAQFLLLEYTFPIIMLYI